MGGFAVFIKRISKKSLARITQLSSDIFFNDTDVRGIFAVLGSDPVGFCIYKLTETKLIINELYIQVPYTYDFVGSRLLKYILREENKALPIIFVVNEDFVLLQKFLRENGFTVTEILHGHYGERDGYTFTLPPRENVRKASPV
jgi:hypothetical protein